MIWAQQMALGQNYEVTVIGTLGGDRSNGWAINDSTEIVGEAETGVLIDGSPVYRAFLWDNSQTVKDIGAGDFSSALDINDESVVVGKSNQGSFFYDSRIPLLFHLGSLDPGGYSEGLGINEHQVIVGSSTYPGGMGHQHAFRWDNSGSNMVDLGTLGGPFSRAHGMNDSGQIVGNSTLVAIPGSFDGWSAFLHDGGQMKALGPMSHGLSSYAKDINNNGQIVGRAFVRVGLSTNYHAYRWVNGTWTDLHAGVPRQHSLAQAINDAGRIVGQGWTPGQVSVAILWKDGVANILNGLIDDNTNIFLTQANDINERDEIVATALVSGAPRGVLLWKKLVRAYYLVPSDKQENTSYTAAIGAALRHLQAWYRDHTGDGTTFALDDPVVKVLRTPHSASWYAATDRGQGETNRFWYNVYTDALDLTHARANDPFGLWLFYIDADYTCNQTGGAAVNSVAILPANDLRGLTSQPIVQVCPQEPPEVAPPCRWVGGLGHELGHALTLDHPPGCDDELPSCDSDALMWNGFRSYPDTYFTAADRSTLTNNDFIDQFTLGVSPANCNVLTPTNATREMPTNRYVLSQNYPNPFNPTTTISYDLPAASDVTLTVVDVLGRQVRVLASGTQPAGTYEVSFDADGLPSGIYFYRLTAGDFTDTKRMVVVR